MVSDAVSLDVRGVRKSFRGQEVLRGVDLVAPRGKVTGLFGPNGAGKTTLFRVLMGLLPADAGTATLEGRDVLAVPLHSKIDLGLGYLPQDSRSFDALSVRDNLLAVLEVRERDPSRRRARLDDMVERTGLAPIAARRYGVLSGGERRRVEIAKALSIGPSILLLDEPFSGLDPRAIAELCEWLRALAAEGTGLLLTDHNVHMALDVVDHAWLLLDGRVARDGSPASLRSDDLARTAYLGRPGTA